MVYDGDDDENDNDNDNDNDDNDSDSNNEDRWWHIECSSLWIFVDQQILVFVFVSFGLSALL